MTETKKPIILVIDDKAEEYFVRNNIKNLATKLGFNGEEIAQQVKVITNGDEALTFIAQAKESNPPISMAFVDNSMQGKSYGILLAKAIKEVSPAAAVAWISSDALKSAEQQHLQENGFSEDDKLMFNDGILSGSIKHFLLNGDLSRVVEMDGQPIHNIFIPAMKKAFQQIAPQKDIPSDVAHNTNPVNDEQRKR